MWQEAFDDFWWLDRFGVTPEQVERMDAAKAARIPLIAEMVDQHRAKQAKNRG